MIFEAKKILLKNGASAVLKTPDVQDAEKQLNCIKSTTMETDFFSRTVEDWEGFTVENEKDWIKGVRDSEHSLVISCFIDEEIAGNCDITFKSGSKNSHRATVGIAIQKKYWNIGIGSAMFRELICAAYEHGGTEIVDLEVVEGNYRAIALYEKFGFEQVSVKKNYFKLKDGRYQNLIYMQKYL